MRKTLILYSTVDGHTIKICEEIRRQLEHSNQCDLQSIDNIDPRNIDDFDWIIIGASIRYGNHRKSVMDFMKHNQHILQQKGNAFFSVNAVARKPEKASPEHNPYVVKFVDRIGWKPPLMAVFAGKIDYPRYNLFDKWAIRLIMSISKGPTDTTSSFEFTDWEKVKAFAANILAEQGNS